MKPRILSTARLSFPLTIAASSLLAVSYSHAADGTWNSDVTNGLWGTDTNWLSNAIADGSGSTAYFTNNITGDRTVHLDGDRTLTSVVFGDNDPTSAGSWTLGNNGVSTNNLILAGATPGITVNALGTGKTARIDAVIQGTVGLVKSGNGTLMLAGTNTYTGATLISGGTLQIGAGGGGGALAITSVITNNANLAFRRNNSSAFTQGTHFAAGISGTGTVTQYGLPANVLTLSGTNTYLGGTFINGGILRADSAGALGGGDVTIGNSGIRLAVLDGVTLANSIVINASTGASGRGLIENTGAGNATLAGGTITINAAAANGGHFASTGGGTLTVNHAINSASTIVSSSAGTVIFGGGGSYSNMNVIGTARLGASNGLSTSATVNMGPAGDGNLDLAGFNQQLVGITKGANAATIGNSLTDTTSTLTTTGTSTYTGIIADNFGSGTGKVALTVNGGALTLSGTNTYTGATTITDGKLVINGSTSSTSLVNVGVNGTLGGTGTVGGHTTISGTHNPGNSPGIQTFAGNLSYVTGGIPDPTVNWELANNTTTVGVNPTAAFDQVIVGGNLDFTNTTTTTINLSFNGAGSTVAWGDILWDSDQSWLLYDVAGTTSNFTHLNLATLDWLDKDGSFFSTTGGSFSLGQSGQDVVLNFTVIPEPNAAALLGGFGILALLRRRRAGVSVIR
jgi:autotransporter-associated beta strand protein